MGLPMESAHGSSPALTNVHVPGSYPAPSKHFSGLVNNIQTDVQLISFSDKILITITQHGRLAQWITVPLEADDPTASDPYFQTMQGASSSSSFEDGDAEAAAESTATATATELLPSTRFQPRTLLGAGSTEREMMGQLYASQIAHAITTKNAAETRSLLLGLGLAKVDVADRNAFLQVIDLVLKVI